MINKRSGLFRTVGSLVVGLTAVNFVGCSLESDDVSQSAFSKRTYVRAHPRGTTRTTVPQIVKAKQVTINSRAVGPELSKPTFPRIANAPVVKLPSTNSFSRYAVAYGKPYAVVQDDSIIPLAFQSKKEAGELKRFTLPFLNKQKAERRAIEDQAKRLERLAQSRPSIRVRTTAYTHDEWDHLKYGRSTAIGTRLRYGQIRSAAADWSRYPVGTQFRIKNEPGILYEVDDYGGALVGTGTIDLYKPSFAGMNRWGVRHVDIEVVKWGSFAKSLQILQPRKKFSHIRRMIASIQNKGTTEQARLTALMMVHGINET